MQEEKTWIGKEDNEMTDSEYIDEFSDMCISGFTGDAAVGINGLAKPVYLENFEQSEVAYYKKAIAAIRPVKSWGFFSVSKPRTYSEIFVIGTKWSFKSHRYLRSLLNKRVFLRQRVSDGTIPACRATLLGVKGGTVGALLDKRLLKYSELDAPYSMDTLITVMVFKKESSAPENQRRAPAVIGVQAAGPEVPAAPVQRVTASELGF